MDSRQHKERRRSRRAMSPNLELLDEQRAPEEVVELVTRGRPDRWSAPPEPEPAPNALYDGWSLPAVIVDLAGGVGLLGFWAWLISLFV